jgi:hypothetical protein
VSDSEHDIQARLVARCRLAKYPVISIPNGAKFGRNPRLAAMQARKLRAEGLEPGIPDLHFPTASCGFHGLWLETKSAKGRPTDVQCEWMQRLTDLGHLALWYRDDEPAFDLVKHYHAGTFWKEFTKHYDAPEPGDFFLDRRSE